MKEEEEVRRKAHRRGYPGQVDNEGNEEEKRRIPRKREENI